ncbi:MULTISPECIES: TetR/AcrR family transcriptional regulator [unclassified Tolypothrix]|uniref:TetR/AcrR family transcriptional regulator n=1 Tax=unclassified Tolypothrix TaxID=2649714 RepID=UPI0005EAAA0A|nr:MULTISPECIES: TetR/AcrR family transcriptional regulator [unclassified Tolypothrix]BAY89595.1 TetR family transcriptional regulator [Microchaete diplosiphon NIES-3275]EKF02575.1 TetR family transcriptional regulator [Tolypothrix sp. PCC 7601]MBE9085402.1 TetR/AcrR family transcriptional regulator [Tolypothrix sp. LEGE 11397]UYD23869.1 TetR/AcrR family transcriptional regulator [Tolypothrix sp. PCC 7712]UYD33906.1 TetR/AcrR family transcriptional regulator [Tolypothrix sp. PCC 7601]
MSKGEETKAKIIRQAAELFNQQGYTGSSISDIMRVTGLQKGGIYNHFQSKDDLALQAFDYAIASVSQQTRAALRSKRHAIERLQAIIGVFSSFVDNPPIKGGCPILNTAIESDDAHAALRERTQKAMDSWRELIRLIIEKGISRGEIRSEVDADEAATIIIATLEGAMMISKLYDDAIHMQRAINHLNQYINNQRNS